MITRQQQMLPRCSCHMLLACTVLSCTVLRAVIGSAVRVEKDKSWALPEWVPRKYAILRWAALRLHLEKQDHPRSPFASTLCHQMGSYRLTSTHTPTTLTPHPSHAGNGVTPALPAPRNTECSCCRCRRDTLAKPTPSSVPPPAATHPSL
jgi:hypothetical protein